MGFLNAILVGLLRLSFKVRLALVTLCLIAGFIPYLFSQFNGPLLAIPLALAAWLFKRQGVIISTVLITLAIATAITIQSHGFSWPAPMRMGTLTGTIALLTEGFCICYLRYLLDLSEAARLQLIQAEQQTRLAYEKQIEALQEKKAMTDAYEQQRHLNQLKDRFILNVSHELRTPIQTLLGYLELLQTFDGRIDDTMRSKGIQRSLHACYELKSLVNNVLASASISSGMQTPKAEVFSVMQVVQDVLELVQLEQLQTALLDLDIPEHLMVFADPQYTRQIILNLLTNAIKYSPGSSTVIISAASTEANGQGSASIPQVCISIKDFGPGIPPEELPLLFERFVRLQRDVAGPVRGTGLGLSISKELVQAMGGQIWGESSGSPGEGCRFSFTLPAATLNMVSEGGLKMRHVTSEN